MKRIILTFFGIALSTSAFALLSPLAQSVREIEAIIKSPELHRELAQSETIQDIRRLDNAYIVVTNRSRMVVDLTYLPAEGPGSQKFKLNFNPPIPIDEDA